MLNGNSVFDLLAIHLWRSCWQGSLLILTILLICKILPRIPASIRCWLWWLACLKLIAGLWWTAPVTLPIFTPSPLPVEVAYSAPAVSVQETPAGMRSGFDARTPNTTPSTPPAQALSSSQPGQAIGATTTETFTTLVAPALLILWLAGAAIRMVLTIRRYGEVQRLVRRTHPIVDCGIGEEVALLARRLNLHRLPRLLEATDSSGPLVAGLLRPAVILPGHTLENLSPSEVRMALAHELAHVRRGDLPLGLVPTLAGILFFFNPLALLAVRQWMAACEAACDAEALRATQESPKDYASLLMKLVVEGSRPAAGVILGATSGYSALKWRLCMLQRISTIHRSLIVGSVALVAVTAVSVIPWQVKSRAAIVLGGPVRLAASTPAQQQGFSLLLIQPGASGDYNFGRRDVGWTKEGAAACLAIRPPQWPDAPRSANGLPAFTASGRSPGGNTFTLPWNIQGGPEARLLLVALPAVLRDVNPYVDVTIQDQRGHVAHWRVLGLPGLQRLIPLPVKPVVQENFAGMTLKARAWRGSDPYFLPDQTILLGDVKMTGTPAGGGQWLLTRTQPMTPEWGLVPPSVPRMPWTSGVTHEAAFMQPGSWTGFLFRSGGFPELSHYLKMKVSLRKFESRQEKLTFHDLQTQTVNGVTYVEVKQFQTLTTPSGITVTLPAQGSFTPRPIIYENGVPYATLKMIVSPLHFPSPSREGPYTFWTTEGTQILQSDSLPRSPLFQQYRKPMTIGVSSPQFYRGLESGSQGTSMVLDYVLKRVPPGHLPELTVILTQQVEVKEIPFSFTVPVSDTIPADWLQRISREHIAMTGNATTGRTTAGSQTTGAAATTVGTSTGSTYSYTTDGFSLPTTTSGGTTAGGGFTTTAGTSTTTTAGTTTAGTTGAVTTPGNATVSTTGGNTGVMRPHPGARGTSTTGFAVTTTTSG